MFLVAVIGRLTRGVIGLEVGNCSSISEAELRF